MSVQWWCSAQGIPWRWYWRPYPGVWLLVLAFGAAYVRLARRSGRRLSPRKTAPANWWFFGGGLALLWAALDWPVGTLGAGYLASAHMIQFLLIVMLTPPLLLRGLRDGLPEAVQERPRLRRTLARLTHPTVALGTYYLVVIATHVPTVVDSLMVSQLGSLALDLSWLAAGLAFWWPLGPPVQVRPPLAAPLRLGAMFLAMLPHQGVGTWLLLSRLPPYRTFELAPPTGWLSARSDQQLAGGFMLLGGTLIMVAAATLIFFRWAAGEETTSEGGAARGHAAAPMAVPAGPARQVRPTSAR